MSGDNHEVKIGLLTIWAMGVGSALGGDFFGWQFVLFGGFYSALTAVTFSAVFYWLYAAAITELAIRYKTTGGAFDFVKSSLGVRPGTLMAILNLLKLVLANSATALAISSYLGQGGLPSNMKFACWVFTYGIFTLLDSVGVRESSALQITATILCVVILLFYSASNFTLFNIANINSRATERYTGVEGFLQGLPFALAFFDGFEEIPLLIGYAIDPDKTIPQAVSICYVTITTIAVLVFISATGATDETILLASDAPLMVGIESVYGVGSVVSDMIAYLIVLGLVVNFYAFIVYTSQQVQTIAEAGFMPSFLAYRHPKHGAPIVASVVASVVGITITAVLSMVLTEDVAQDTLLAASLMPAIVGYVLLLECIVRIRAVEAKYVDSANSRQQVVSYRDAEVLGVEPKLLRFIYGTWGARLAQAMCVVMFIGLLVLASTSFNYMYGLLVTSVLGVLSYVVMITLVRDQLQDEASYGRSAGAGGEYGKVGGGGIFDGVGDDTAHLLGGNDKSSGLRHTDSGKVQNLVKEKEQNIERNGAIASAVVAITPSKRGEGSQKDVVHV